MYVGGSLDFQLNDEQLQLKKSVREYAEREIAPNVMKWDEAGENARDTPHRTGRRRREPGRVPRCVRHPAGFRVRPP